MVVETRSLRFKTNGNAEVVDVTGRVQQGIQESGVTSGIVTVFAVGSTAGITTIEHESGLIADIKEMWDRLVPARAGYQHDRAWGDGNGHSHLRSALVGTSLTVPFVSKRMTLGTWQQIVYIDFDNRPRSREIILQIMGE